MSNKAKPKPQQIQKEEVKQAVVVDVIGASLTLLSGKSLLAFTLEWLELERFDEVFVCCQPNNAQAIRNHVAEFYPSASATAPSDGRRPNVTVHPSEKNQSLGDCLRELDSKAVIKSDFIVMNVGCSANINLSELLEQHKCLRKVDKNAILTSIARSVTGKQLVRNARRAIYVCDTKTGRLMQYEVIGNNNNDLDDTVSAPADGQPSSMSESKPKKSIAIETRLFHQSQSVKIYSNLVDTNMAICSPNVPLLFSDNFDYRTQDDLIRGIFDNEEVLGNSVYIHVVNDYFSQNIADPLGGYMSQRAESIGHNFALYRNKSFNTLRQVSSDSLLRCGRIDQTPDNCQYLLNDSDLEESAGESDDESSAELVDDDDGRFYVEVLDSFVGGYEENTKCENLILEINASKHAYNISMSDIHANIIKALIELPHSLKSSEQPATHGEYFAVLTKALNQFQAVFLNYISKADSRQTLLVTLENLYLTETSQFLNDSVLAKLLYTLYDLDILNEDSIIDWFNNAKSECKNNDESEDSDDDDDDGEDLSRVQLRSRPGIRKLVETLQAQTDSESEDDEDDD